MLAMLQQPWVANQASTAGMVLSCLQAACKEKFGRDALMMRPDGVREGGRRNKRRGRHARRAREGEGMGEGGGEGDGVGEGVGSYDAEDRNLGRPNESKERSGGIQVSGAGDGDYDGGGGGGTGEGGKVDRDSEAAGGRGVRKGEEGAEGKEREIEEGRDAESASEEAGDERGDGERVKREGEREDEMHCGHVPGDEGGDDSEHEGNIEGEEVKRERMEGEEAEGGSVAVNGRQERGVAATDGNLMARDVGSDRSSDERGGSSEEDDSESEADGESARERAVVGRCGLEVLAAALLQVGDGALPLAAQASACELLLALQRHHVARQLQVRGGRGRGHGMRGSWRDAGSKEQFH